jgi:hypothetical protein
VRRLPQCLPGGERPEETLTQVIAICIHWARANVARQPVPTSLDNGRRSPKNLLRAIVAGLLGRKPLEKRDRANPSHLRRKDGPLTPVHRTALQSLPFSGYPVRCWRNVQAAGPPRKLPTRRRRSAGRAETAGTQAPSRRLEVLASGYPPETRPECRPGDIDSLQLRLPMPGHHFGLGLGAVVLRGERSSRPPSSGSPSRPLRLQAVRLQGQRRRGGPHHESRHLSRVSPFPRHVA